MFSGYYTTYLRPPPPPENLCQVLRAGLWLLELVVRQGVAAHCHSGRHYFKKKSKDTVGTVFDVFLLNLENICWRRTCQALQLTVYSLFLSSARVLIS